MGISRQDFKYLRPKSHKEMDLNPTSPPIAIESTTSNIGLLLNANQNINSKVSVQHDSQMIKMTSVGIKPVKPLSLSFCKRRTPITSVIAAYNIHKV